MGAIKDCGTAWNNLFCFYKKLNKFQCADRPCRCVEGLF